MCEVCTHIDRPVLQVNATDPTRTLTLRNAFVRDMRRRFRELKQVIRQAIVERDCFGLQQPQVFQEPLTPPNYRQFAFPRNSDKVRSFMNWLKIQEQKGLLETGTMTQIGSAAEDAWTNIYIKDSYKRGVMRARYEMDRAGFDVPPLEGTGAVETTMAFPGHVDHVGLIYTRTFNELQGITSSMDQQISRVLAQGLVDGDNPRLLARKLVSVVDGSGAGTLGITDQLGRRIPPQRRAEILARTEVIRAHHQAMVQEYENWAVEGVVVKAEWMTAGDNRVCERCAGLEGQVFTLQEIRNMIPLHPQCRCVALPYKEPT